MKDKVLMLITDQNNFLRVRASHIRALVMGDVGDAWYKVYIEGCPTAFLITEASAKEVGNAQDGLV